MGGIAVSGTPAKEIFCQDNPSLRRRPGYGPIFLKAEFCNFFLKD